MATYTSTVFANQQPKAVHAGNQSQSGQIVWPIASSAGDVAFLCKLPKGATIVEVIEDHSTGSSTQVLDFGYIVNASATFSAFISGGAQAAVNRRNVLGIPVNISVSDDGAVPYAIFACKVASGTATTSLFVNFTITYRMDI